jgi:hypothetical protein
MIDRQRWQVVHLHRWLAGLLTAALLIGTGFAAPRTALAQAPTPAMPDAGQSLYLPVALRDACNGLKSAGFGGFQVYGGANSGSPYHSALMDSGASWVRLVIDWSQIEPKNTTPANYSWRETDSIARLAYERCMPIIFLFENNPAWASSLAQGPLDKVGLSELVQVMQAIVERYDGDGFQDAPGSPQVIYFEMYNEPDMGLVASEERWGNYGDKYAAMLKAVYPAIKQVNPDAKVVFGGIAYDNFSDATWAGPFVRKFLDDVLKNGGGAYFDIMNYHFYPHFGYNWTKNFPKDGPGLVEKTEAIRAVLRKYNVNKPVIITEMGWHSNGRAPYGSYVLQTRYLQQVFTQAKAAGIPMAAWWPLADPRDAFDNGDTGVITNKNFPPITRKPSYFAYQTFMREIAPARFVAEVASEPDIKIYQFQDDAKNRTIYVAWTNPTDMGTMWGTPTVPYKDSTRTTTIKLKANSAELYNYTWSPQATIADADDGKRDGFITVWISGSPGYIVVGG